MAPYCARPGPGDTAERHHSSAKSPAGARPVALVRRLGTSDGSLMRTRRSILAVVLLVLSGALAGQVMRGGSIGWGLVRVAAVAGAASVLLYGIWHGGPLRRAVSALIAGCAGTVAGAGIGG